MNRSEEPSPAELIWISVLPLTRLTCKPVSAPRVVIVIVPVVEVRAAFESVA